MRIIILGIALFGSTVFGVSLTSIVKTGLKLPIEVVTAPGDTDRLFVVEQEGRIRTIEKGKLDPKPFLDISANVTAGGEMGLLSLAFHPKYASNKRFFVNYTARRPDLVTIIAEYEAGKPTEKEILRFAQPYSNHNGGQLAFDAKGLLYIATGDGGASADPHGNGQKTDTLLGKILRLDIDQAKPYSIPSGNPFATTGGRKEIFALGLRNPWRFSFDSKTGALFAADVGQYLWEEINLIEAGGNYGWDAREGKHCFEPKEGCVTKAVTDPIFEYGRAEGYSITGGYVYRGKKIRTLAGAYVYADYGSGKIWALHYDQTAKKVLKNELLLDTIHPISSFGLDSEGEILVVSHQGPIFRLAP